MIGDSGSSKVYLPGSKVDEEDDCRPSKLVVDESAYIMLHKAHTGSIVCTL